MKPYLIVLLFSLFLCLSVWGQGASFTQSAPISVSGDGLAGKKGEDEATMKAREELSRSRVKEVENSAAKEQQEQQTEQKQKLIEKSTASWSKDLHFSGRPSFIEFSWGSLFSSWSDVSSELEDDSWATSFAWGRFFHPQFSSSIGIEFIHPQEQQYVAEEIRLFQLSGTLKHHYQLSNDFALVPGGSLLIADWNVRKKVSTINSQEIYQSYNSGSGVGLRPEVSLRWHMSDVSHLDLKSSWSQYFGNPQNDFGGLGLAFQLHIQL